MNEEQLQSASNALAVVSLTLGVVALLISPLIVGVVFAVVGVILGAVHLSKRTDAGRGLARAGTIVSAVAILATAGIAAGYYQMYKNFRAVMEGMGGGTDYTAFVGTEAPDFSVTALDGTAVKLHDLRGKHVVVDFWATWCGPCRMMIPHLVQLASEHRDDLVILGISSEEESELRAFAEEHGINYLVASFDESTLPEPFNLVQAYPTTFFINPAGAITSVDVGYTDYEHLKAAIFTGTP